LEVNSKPFDAFIQCGHEENEDEGTEKT